MFSNFFHKVKETGCNEAICSDGNIYRAPIVSSFALSYSLSRNVEEFWCAINPACENYLAKSPSIDECQINQLADLSCSGVWHSGFATLVTMPIFTIQAISCCSLGLVSAPILCFLSPFFGDGNDLTSFYSPTYAAFQYTSLGICSNDLFENKNKSIAYLLKIDEKFIKKLAKTLENNQLNFNEFLRNPPIYFNDCKNKPNLNENGVNDDNYIFCFYAYMTYHSNTIKDKYSIYRNNYFYQNFVLNFGDHPVKKLQENIEKSNYYHTNQQNIDIFLRVCNDLINEDRNFLQIYRQNNLTISAALVLSGNEEVLPRQIVMSSQPNSTLTPNLSLQIWSPKPQDLESSLSRGGV